MKLPQSIFLLPAVTSTICLREGMRLKTGGIAFVLLEKSGSELVLKREDEHEYMRTTEHELLEAIQSGEVTSEEQPDRRTLLLNGLSALRDADVRRASGVAIQVAEDKLRWLHALKLRGIDRIVDRPWVRSIIKQLAEGELKGARRFAISTLYSAQLALAKADGDVTSLVPNFNGRGGAGASRMDPRAQLIAQDTLRAIRERRGKFVLQAVASEIKEQIDSRNTGQPSELIKVPSESTLKRFVKANVSSFEILVSKRGKRAARAEFRENAYARDTAVRPLEKSEWDDIDSAVFCVDERNGLPWGRAFITNGIDQFSGVPLGFDLGGTPRSFESMIGAICHSLLPKPVDESGTWDGYGCQGAMLLDNARYNFCQAAKKQSDSLRLLLSGAQPRAPTEKSSIEHFNKRIKSEFCSLLPGWAGEKGDREALNEGAASAVLTVQELRKRYLTWVCRQYMNKPTADGRTPRQIWNSYFDRFGPAIRYSSDQLALMRLVPERLTRRDSSGLLRLSIRYTSDELESLLKRIGKKEKVQCYIDRRDMSYLMVLNPFTGQLLKVDSSEDPHYTRNLTEYQQRLIRAKARQFGWNNPSMRECVKARRELEEQAAKASTSKFMRKRRWARRAVAVDEDAEAALMGNKKLGTSPKEKSEFEERTVTELESQMIDLEEFLRDLSEEDDF